MNAEVRQAWRQAIETGMARIGARPVFENVPMLKWTRGVPGSWGGITQYELQPSISSAHLPMDDVAAMLLAAMQKHYPEHCTLIGCQTFGWSNVGMSNYLHQTLWHLWRQHNSFTLTTQEIDAILDDIAAFIDSPTIQIDFTAPLVNFDAPDDVTALTLSPDITIARLSNDEVNEYFGGRVDMMSHMQRRNAGPLGYALKGSFEEPKTFGTDDHPSNVSEPYREAINNAIVALRTFKTGAVGYDEVHFKPRHYSPFVHSMARFWADSYVPVAIGHFRLESGEAPALITHAGNLQARIHPSLLAACSRLAAGEIRLSASEKLFDAVVGLEAILLFDGNDETYRGELRYRFAMNLASLQGNESEKREHFKIGKALYDLRSKVAHGGIVDQSSVRFGSEQVPFSEAANRSCELLRSLIKKFAVNAESPEYLSSEYWTSHYFA